MFGKLWIRRSRSSQDDAANSAVPAEDLDADGIASLLLGKRSPPRDDYFDQIRSLRSKAENGDRDAQCELALALWKGRSDSEHCNEANGYVPQDVDGALQWWRAAAEQGDSRAQVNLAYLYLTGRNIPYDGTPISDPAWNERRDERQKKISEQAGEAKKWLRLAADGGDVGAQFVLGWMHYTNLPSSTDKARASVRDRELAEAAKWCLKAAEQGHAEAQKIYGDVTRQEMKDLAASIVWYQKAAEQGVISAQETLGDFFSLGIGAPQNLAEAARWYRTAADSGSEHAKDAQQKLGYMYAVGKGVPQNFTEASRLFRLAAERDWWNEYNEYYYCRYEHSQYPADGVAWLCKVAAEGWKFAPGIILRMKEEATKQTEENRIRWPASHEFEEFALGALREMSDVLKELTQAAEQGDVNAQICLGLIDCCGGLRWRSDEGERRGAVWFRRATDQGSAIANRFLGDLYDRGVGMSRDTEKAETHFRIAAELGDAGAQYAIGNILRDAALKSGRWSQWADQLMRDRSGAVLPGQVLIPLRECTEAADWYSKAAEQGQIQAQYELAELCAEGRGVPWDVTKALKLWRRAAEQGYAKAQHKLAKAHSKRSGWYSPLSGIPEDDAKAAYWCERAAKQHHSRAVPDIEFRYFDGKGVEQDGAKALFWHELGNWFARSFR